ncbi:hypothetical protein ONZ45_g1369 [Pleurotus djamor]|nr:hypothetical protein ONZ45_g12575 [Pleurotus djamor]KAJ8521981.1 hypothetical protein ONZ45_g1369 [Pleurotus djamor]
MSSDPETKRKLEDFRKQVAARGEEIIFKIFPTKVIELQKTIQSFSNADSPFNFDNAPKTDTTVYPAPSPDTPQETEELHAKKRKRTEDGFLEEGSSRHLHHPKYVEVVQAYRHMTPLHDVIRQECEELAELVDQVKLWVNLTMPKIEDGDNFGVQVQEEVLSELMRAQESAYNLRDAARQDHLARAKICSKLIKYPNVEDYTMALHEHDRKQVYFARQHVIDIRSVYAILTDLLQKNISKIRAPKGNNSVGLY